MKHVRLRQHGSTNPLEVDLFDLVGRAQSPRLISTSEMIIAFHYIPEDLAEEIGKRVLNPKQAELFHKLRKISPTEFLPRTRKQKFIARFKAPKPITWVHYAHKLNIESKHFWPLYADTTHRIIAHVMETPHFAKHLANQFPSL